MDLWTELLLHDVIEYQSPKVSAWALYEVLQDFVCSGHVLQQGCTVVWDGKSEVLLDGSVVHCPTFNRYRYIFRKIRDVPDLEGASQEPGFTGLLYYAQTSFQVRHHDIKSGDMVLWDGHNIISHGGELLRCDFDDLINQGLVRCR